MTGLRALIVLGLSLCSALATAIVPRQADAREVPSRTAQASACPELQAWLNAWNELDRPYDLKAAQIRERAAREEVADRYFAAYLARSFDAARLDQCLAGHPERQGFVATLQSRFFENTIARLSVKRVRGPAIRAFVREFESRRSKGEYLIFRMTGHFRETSPTPFKAGFHRGSASVYADFARIDPDEWTLIVIHEVLHYLDERIPQASREYTALLPKVMKGDTSQLREFLVAGLDRGLWAEYRAWVPTFVIYLEGLKDGLWPHIDWVEQVLADRGSQEAFAPFVYRFLDERSKNPSHAPLDRAKIRGALEDLRARAASGEVPEVQLGNLGRIVAKSRECGRIR